MNRVRPAVLACAAGLLGVPLAAPAAAVPVSGYVAIAWIAPATAPVVTVGGALTTWSCVQTVWPATGPFSVTCAPPVGSGPWECDGMLAEARTYSPAGTLRTTLSCDGMVAAQTATVSGAGGAHVVPAMPGRRANRSLTCTVDDGGVPLTAVPDYAGVCRAERAVEG